MNDPDTPSTWLEMPSADPFGQWMARRKWKGSAHLVRGDLRTLAYCGLSGAFIHEPSLMIRSTRAAADA